MLRRSLPARSVDCRACSDKPVVRARAHKELTQRPSQSRRQFLAGCGTLLTCWEPVARAQEAASSGSTSPSVSNGSQQVAPDTGASNGNGNGSSVQPPPVTTVPAPSAPGEAQPPNPRDSVTLSDAAAQRYLQEEDERRRREKGSKRGRGKFVELEEIRAQLAEKQYILLEKEAELLQKDQTVMVLQEELDLERKLRALLTKEKEKAEEQAALAMGLCTGGAMLP